MPAIAAAAHAREVTVAIDNTYSAGVLFDAFRHGVDISVQALTKDARRSQRSLARLISVRSEANFERVGAAAAAVGMAVSPDDASLALRGLQTMGVRLERLEASTLEVARWLAERPEVETGPASAPPSCPGHEACQRDFHGSASIFSIVFAPSVSRPPSKPLQTAYGCSRPGIAGAARPLSS